MLTLKLQNKRVGESYFLRERFQIVNVHRKIEIESSFYHSSNNKWLSMEGKTIWWKTDGQRMWKNLTDTTLTKLRGILQNNRPSVFKTVMKD